MEQKREYISITTVQEYLSQPLHSYRVLGRRFGVFRDEGGRYYALETSCKHQGADLLAGEVRGAVAVCHRHQWRYDLRSGQCLSHPSPPLRRHDVIVVGEVLKMAALADEDSLDP